MKKENIINFIGKQKPSYFEYDGKKTPNHMSYFIIPFPHAVHDGILRKQNISAKKTNPYNKNSLIDRIDFFLDGMEKNGWKLNNLEDKKLFGCQDTIKRYIYANMISYLDKDKKRKIAFFKAKNNLLFEYNCNNEKWSLMIDSQEIRFIMQSFDLWIMDDHISFLVLKTSIDLENSLNITDISSKLNRELRDFRNLDIDFEKKTISTNGGNLLKRFLEEKLSFENISLLNTNLKSLNDSKFYTIFNSSFYAKMITALHIDEYKTDQDEMIEPKDEGVFNLAEVHDINIMEHCSYLLGSTSEFYPKDDFIADYGYIREQIYSCGGIGIWKYWSGLALHDSLSFFGIKKDASSLFVNQARNEYYFIYMLNMYISYKIRYFEQELIDKEFKEVEKIKNIKEKLQRLKNEFISREIAKRFQPNEINSAIQKGMGYMEVYNEVELNIDNTLSLSKDRIAEFISFFGLILFFQDEIKIFFVDNILNSSFGLFLKYSPTEFKILLTVAFIIILFFMKTKILTSFKKFNSFIINKKRDFF